MVCVQRVVPEKDNHYLGILHSVSASSSNVLLSVAVLVEVHTSAQMPPGPILLFTSCPNSPAIQDLLHTNPFVRIRAIAHHKNRMKSTEVQTLGAL